MLINEHWAAKVAGRVFAYAIISGIFTALIGALCIGAAGALLGAILDIRSTPATWDSGFLLPGAWLGTFLGAWSGFVGLIVGAVAAFNEAPDRSLAPPRPLLGRVALGQLFGTGCAVSFYLVFALAVAQFNGDPFIGTVEDNLEFIIWGAPALMICGAIAGAFWKREANR